MLSSLYFASLLFSLQKKRFLYSCLAVAAMSTLLLLDSRLLSALLLFAILWVGFSLYVRSLQIIHKGSLSWIWFAPAIQSRHKAMGIFALGAAYLAALLGILYIMTQFWYLVFPSLSIAQSGGGAGGMLSFYLGIYVFCLCFIPGVSYGALRLHHYALISSVIVLIGLMLLALGAFVIMVPLSATTEYLRNLVSWALHPGSEVPTLFRPGYLRVAVPLVIAVFLIDVFVMWIQLVYVISTIQISWRSTRA